MVSKFLGDSTRVYLEHIYGKVTLNDPREYPYQKTGVT